MRKPCTDIIAVKITTAAKLNGYIGPQGIVYHGKAEDEEEENNRSCG